MNPLRSLLGRLLGTPAAAPGGELVTGIVHPRGASGGQAPPSTDWTLRFTLEEWRGADGVIRATPLAIRQTTTAEELGRLMERINGTRILTARVRFDGEGSAELIGLLKGFIPADDPLALRAIELSRPVTHESERFGTLRLNRMLGGWECAAAWDGETIDLALQAKEPGELEAALATAGGLWDAEAEWSERIAAYAAKHLLELKNDSWLDEDEEELTEADFRERIRLQSVTVDAAGGFTFWHDDGDLFWGHSIQVDGTLADGPTHAGIAG